MKKTKILALLGKDFDREEKEFLLKILDSVKKVKDLEETQTLTFPDFLEKCNISHTNYNLAIRASFRSHQVFLRRDPSQMFINPFIPKILKRMRSNMDAQMILDPYGVDYINKSDRGLSNTMKKAWKEIKEGNFSPRDSFRRIVNTFYNNSEMSVQEACYNILQLHMSECSEHCIYIPLSERVRIVIPQKDLLNQDPNQQKFLFQTFLITIHIDLPLLRVGVWQNLAPNVNSLLKAAQEQYLWKEQGVSFM